MREGLRQTPILVIFVLHYVSIRLSMQEAQKQNSYNSQLTPHEMSFTQHEEQAKKKRHLLLVFMGGLLVSSSAVQIVYKFQNETTYVNDQGQEVKWRHPFFTTFLQSVGQSFTCLLYVAEKKCLKSNPKKEEAQVLIHKRSLNQSVNDQEKNEIAKPKQMNIWLLSIPSVFDIIENACKNIALSLISSSVTQMMRSSVIVFTAFLSLLFLKRKLYRHHWSSLFAMVLGIFLVGLSSMLAKSSGKSQQNIWGIIILLVGQLFGASGYIIEEKLLGDFEDFDPLLMAGVEGVFAVGMWAFILPILQLIPCDDPNICQSPNVENTLEAFKEYQRQPLHYLFTFLIIILMPIMYGSGLSITKYGSAASRTTIESARNIIIWVFFLFVPVYGTLVESFSVLQLSGFLILLLGVLVYNEIIVLPFLGFNRYTSEALARKEDYLEKQRSIKEFEQLFTLQIILRVQFSLSMPLLPKKWRKESASSQQ